MGLDAYVVFRAHAGVEITKLGWAYSPTCTTHSTTRSARSGGRPHLRPRRCQSGFDGRRFRQAGEGAGESIRSRRGQGCPTQDAKPTGSALPKKDCRSMAHFTSASRALPNAPKPETRPSVTPAKPFSKRAALQRTRNPERYFELSACDNVDLIDRAEAAAKSARKGAGPSRSDASFTQPQERTIIQTCRRICPSSRHCARGNATRGHRDSHWLKNFYERVTDAVPTYLRDNSLDLLRVTEY